MNHERASIMWLGSVRAAWKLALGGCADRCAVRGRVNSAAAAEVAA
jgi:hypothetical protein